MLIVGVNSVCRTANFGSGIHLADERSVLAEKVTLSGESSVSHIRAADTTWKVWRHIAVDYAADTIWDISKREACRRTEWRQL